MANYKFEKNEANMGDFMLSPLIRVRIKKSSNIQLKSGNFLRSGSFLKILHIEHDRFLSLLGSYIPNLKALKAL